MASARLQTPIAREFAATLRLAVPLAAANLLQMAVYAIDVIFVARLGQQALAASSLAVSLFVLVVWGFTGLTGAVAPLIAADLGRRRNPVREARRSVRMALWLVLLTGALGFVLCTYGEAFLLLTGQDEMLARRAGDYLEIIRWATIPMLTSNVLRIFVSALDRAVFATMITAGAILVNGAANYALVFGNWGAPALGLEGAALASVITAVLTTCAYIAAIQTDRRTKRYRLFGRFWRTEWSRMREIVRIGLPIGLTVIAEAGLFSAAAFLMGRIGAAELAAHTLALQVVSIFFQVPFGIAQAATIRVGFHFGAQDREGIRMAGWAALVIGGGFMLVSALTMLTIPRSILSLYVDVTAPANAALVAFAVSYLGVAAMFQLFDGTQTVAAGVLRGLQDTRVPMWIALGGYWAIGFVVAASLGLGSPLRGIGVWLGLAAGLVTVAALLLRRWSERERLGLVPIHRNGLERSGLRPAARKAERPPAGAP